LQIRRESTALPDQSGASWNHVANWCVAYGRGVSLADKISLDSMSKVFRAPRTIRRIAARRVFRSRGGKSVVLTLGVPQPVPGSDWGCALQITGLGGSWRRPKYVFGIDGLQALHLAMKCAGSVLESATLELERLGQKEDLGMPRFLPDPPKPQQDRLEALVERETARFWARVERRHRAKPYAKSGKRKGRTVLT
jgi:hypothetical protein